jgi:hypothetical protein
LIRKLTQIFFNIREDWRGHLHLRHTVPDGLCQGGASVSGLNFDFEKALLRNCVAREHGKTYFLDDLRFEMFYA